MHLKLLILFSLYLVQLYTTSNWMTFHVKVPFCSSNDKCRNCVGRSELLLTHRNQLLQLTHKLNGQLKHTNLVIFRCSLVSILNNHFSLKEVILKVHNVPVGEGNFVDFEIYQTKLRISRRRALWNNQVRRILKKLYLI